MFVDFFLLYKVSDKRVGGVGGVGVQRKEQNVES
jgi:hypothetical protein